MTYKLFQLNKNDNVYWKNSIIPQKVKYVDENYIITANKKYYSVFNIKSNQCAPVYPRGFIDFNNEEDLKKLIDNLNENKVKMMNVKDIESVININKTFKL